MRRGRGRLVERFAPLLGGQEALIPGLPLFVISRLADGYASLFTDGYASLFAPLFTDGYASLFAPLFTDGYASLFAPRFAPLLAAALVPPDYGADNEIHSQVIHHHKS